MDGVYFLFFSFLEHCDSARIKWRPSEDNGIIVKYIVDTVQ